MPSSPIEDLAALLNLDRIALEAVVPGIDVLLSDDRLSGLRPLIAAAARREHAFASTDTALRAQILQYHAAELMTDRERAIFLGLPDGCRIRERAKILAPEKLVMGKNVWIGEGVMLDAQGGLSIGDNSQIGGGVMIWTHSSHLQAIRGETNVGRESIVYAETRIGKNCFIVGPSVIAAGVTIGDGVTISPLTFVDRDVADGERVSAPRSLKTLERRLSALEERFAALEAGEE